MSVIYTVGDAKRTQFAQRGDGVWFVRKIWRGRWGKWLEYGNQRPFEFGVYKAPGYGRAELPEDVEQTTTLLHARNARCAD